MCLFGIFLRRAVVSITDRNSLFQGLLTGASVLPGLRGCKSLSAEPPRIADALQRAVGAAMENFAAHHGIVALSSEVLRQSRDLVDNRRLRPGVAIMIDPGPPRTNSREKSGAGGIADWHGSVAIGKKRPLRGEAIDVRRDRIGVAAEAADPVVHVINDDNEHVGFWRFSCMALRQNCRDAEKNQNRRKFCEFHEILRVMIYPAGFHHASSRVRRAVTFSGFDSARLLFSPGSSARSKRRIPVK